MWYKRERDFKKKILIKYLQALNLLKIELF